MSREIKFRAWDKRSNCWEDFNDLKISKNGVVFDKDYDWEEEVWYDKADEEHNFAIEQYTGLKDKNGKEIYEGDIVRYADDYEENAEVVFNDGGFQVEWPINIERLEGDITCMMEVIGNVHENPELLRDEE